MSRGEIFKEEQLKWKGWPNKMANDMDHESNRKYV